MDLDSDRCRSCMKYPYCAWREEHGLPDNCDDAWYARHLADDFGMEVEYYGDEKR